MYMIRKDLQNDYLRSITFFRSLIPEVTMIFIPNKGFSKRENNTKKINYDLRKKRDNILFVK